MLNYINIQSYNIQLKNQRLTVFDMDYFVLLCNGFPFNDALDITALAKINYLHRTFIIKTLMVWVGANCGTIIGSAKDNLIHKCNSV